MNTNDYSNVSVQDESSGTIIHAVRRISMDIWAKPIHTFYTDHGISHSERILKLTNQLLSNMHGKPLTNDERIIYLSAAYLHDIGMQLPQYTDIKPKENYSVEEKNLIRANHHIASEKAIRDKTHSLGGLFNGAMIDFIATVARYHRTDRSDINELYNVSYHGDIVRIPLLASLLRICDELDIDNRRVDFNSTDFKALDPLTKVHWYSHFYVDSVSIDKGRILVSLRLPSNPISLMAIRSLIKTLAWNIQQRLDKGVFSILFYNGIHLYPRIRISESMQNNAEDLSEDVVCFVEQSAKDISFEHVLDRKSMERPFPLLNRNYLTKDSHIYISAGKRYEIGCIDPKYKEDNLLTCGQMILARPDYILRAISPYPEIVTIHTNTYPTIDIFISYFLVNILVEKGRIDEIASALTEYSADSVSCRNPIRKNNRYTLNMYLYAITALDNKSAIERMNYAKTVLAIAYEIISIHTTAIDSEVFSRHLEARSEIEYLKHLLDCDFELFTSSLVHQVFNQHSRRLETQCTIQQRKLLLRRGTIEKTSDSIDVYLWRDVPMCEFHWLWPKDQDVLTFIPTMLNKRIEICGIQCSISKYYFSLRGDSRYSLEGLSDLLNESEAAKRLSLHNASGIENTRKDLETFIYGRWNSPARFENTYVSSPSRGSMLTISDVMRIFEEYTTSFL